MPIFPKLNLKAAVRINDAALIPPVVLQQDTCLESVSKEISTESIVDESQSGNVKCSPSDDELTPAPADDFDYDDENDFKSPPPSCLLNTQFRVELSEDDSHASNSPQSVDQNISISGGLTDLTNNDHVEISLQSYSDFDSISEHSIHSDTSYTREALQIVANSKQQANNFTVIKEPPSPSAASDTVVRSRKRRRAISKLTEDPTKLPLCDLLFYNPPPTIFQSKAQEELNNNETTTTTTKKVASPVKKLRSSRSSSVASEASVKSGNGLTELDDDAIKSGDENSEKDISNNTNTGDEPLLTIDESGHIVIKNLDALNESKDKKPEAKMKSSTTYSSFRRRERSKNIWNTEETGMFYTALEIVGTDFSLMEAVFFKDRGRSRKQLKQKFKREEKVNRDYIDSILYKSLRNRSKLNSHLLQAAANGGNISVDDNGPTVANSEANNVVLQSA